MAEGFARKYGADVMLPASAGFSPAPIVQVLTKKVMEEKNIKIDDQYPKDLNAVDIPSFNLIINMSGSRLPARMPIEVREWKIVDPIGRSEEIYVKVRDEIEHRVMRLILEFRREIKNAQRPPAMGESLGPVLRRSK